MEEVRRAIEHSKNGKSTGIDNIPNEILKNPKLLDPLHKLYQYCFENSVVPDCWYKSIIQPIHKRGKDPFNPLNYRGISLMSTVAKIFSTVLNNRITKHLDENGLLCNEQNGFRKLRSCLDHIYTLTSIVRNRKLQKLPTYICFVDFAKAFDSVDHDLLWYKLINHGIHGKILKVIQTLYSQLQSCVRVNDNFTDWFSISSGVRQGDNLAPTLFAVFINDLANEINMTQCGVSVSEQMISLLMYADDIILISDSQEGLQTQLDTLNKWSTKWSLSINVDKTKVIHFRKASDPCSTFNFHLGDNTIDIVNSYRYLGLELNETLDYTYSAQILSDAGSRALGALTFKYIRSQGLHFDTYTKLFNSTVVPVVDYAAAVWASKTYACCENVQHRAIRTFLGTGKKSPLPAIDGDMGWIPAHIRQQKEIVRYFIRLCKLPDERLEKTVFNWEYNLCAQGKKNWCKDAKNLFYKCNLNQVYDSKNSSGLALSVVLQTIEANLLLAYTESWKTSVIEMPKLRTYKTFKSEFKTEAYVKTNVLNKRQRSVIAKMRNGTYPLEIELGRYRGLSAENRTCKLCKSEAETEEHFLLKCVKTDDIRRQMISDISSVLQHDGISFRTLSLADKLIVMLSNVHVAKHIANFTILATEKKYKLLRK